MKKIVLAAMTIILLYNPIFGQNWFVFYFEQDTNYNKYFYKDSTDTDNLWQVGKPHKLVFDSAYNKPNALVTDTANTYAPNNTSSIMFWQIVKKPVITVSYYYKMNSDTLVDCAKIEASINRGLTWIDLTAQISPFHVWHIPQIFSGNTSGWKFAQFEFEVDYFNLLPGDTVDFKFSFTSDGIDTHKDGWMIDDIFMLHSAGIGINENYMANNSINISPNPFTTSTQITLDKTYYNISLAVYDIQGKLMLQKQYADCDRVQLNRNGLSNGMYFLKLTLDEKWVETGKIVVRE